MRLGSNSTLWLELLGGLLIVIGVALAWIALNVGNQSIDPNLSKALMRFRLDFPGFLEGLARHMSGVGAGMAGLGAVLFFWGQLFGHGLSLCAGNWGLVCAGGLVATTFLVQLIRWFRLR